METTLAVRNNRTGREDSRRFANEDEALTFCAEYLCNKFPFQAIQVPAFLQELIARREATYNDVTLKLIERN